MSLSAAARERLASLSAELQDAQRPVRILRALAWDDGAFEDFSAAGGQRLPRPRYEPLRFDSDEVARRLRDIAARAAGAHPAFELLRDTCESYAVAAEMLAAIGTRRFFELSSQLYGTASSMSCDGRTTNLDLARHFDQVLARYATKQSLPEEPAISVEDAARELDGRLERFFEGHEVRVEIVDKLSANAVAGSDIVKLNRAARFTRRDVTQLECHEGHVHVATSVNGRNQALLPFLANGAPRTTRTQEGLAIFTEFLSHSIDLDRLRRLADRTLAIHMTEEGASFIDVYRYLLENGNAPLAAFDAARRTFRGGVLEGGAPFTKDVVYLDGLLRVTNFLRAVLTHGRADFVAVLFAGKLALEDIPALAELRRAGVLAEPRFVPPWARDPGFLTAYMSFSAFLGNVDLEASRAYYDDLIARAEADVAPEV